MQTSSLMQGTTPSIHLCLWFWSANLAVSLPCSCFSFYGATKFSTFLQLHIVHLYVYNWCALWQLNICPCVSV